LSPNTTEKSKNTPSNSALSNPTKNTNPHS
jgi:hypothetical protein